MWKAIDADNNEKSNNKGNRMRTGDECNTALRKNKTGKVGNSLGVGSTINSFC